MKEFIKMNVKFILRRVLNIKTNNAMESVIRDNK